MRFNNVAIQGSSKWPLVCAQTTFSLCFGLIFVRGKLNPANRSGLSFRKYMPVSNYTQSNTNFLPIIIQITLHKSHIDRCEDLAASPKHQKLNTYSIPDELNKMVSLLILTLELFHFSLEIAFDCYILLSQS